MRPLRLAFLALLLASTGCCWWDIVPRSCVTGSPGYERCRDLARLDCRTEGDPPLLTDTGCGGEEHDRTCADLGFTVDCGGGSFARPGGC